MLVISRKKDEAVVINNDITVVVVEIRGDKVRLGVDVPREVPVHRKEVYDAIRGADQLPFDDLVESIRAGGTPDSSRPAPIAKCELTLSLSSGQLEMLDEIRGHIAQASEERPTREQVAQALFEALQPFAGELAQSRSLEDVRSFVSLAIRGKSWQ